MSDTPRIYVADLAAYNSGHLHGIWIDASDDLEDIQDAVKEMLALSPIDNAEEYAIHDDEGFGQYEVGEYQNLESVNNVACFIEEFPNFGSELLNHCCDDLDDARKCADESYHGCHASLADYAQELTESTEDIPKHLEFYIDYERMGRDMDMSGKIFTITTGHDKVHIFLNS